MNYATSRQSVRSLVLAGLVPVIVFTVVEEVWGTLWGLMIAMVFGLGELAYEKIKFGKIQKLTWMGNGALLLLGGVSLWTSDGVFFKLQPAIMEALMGLFLWGSSALGQPILIVMGEAQGLFERIAEPLRPFFRRAFAGLNFRLGFFFMAHAMLATWAAFYWSTAAWAWLKGLGFTASMVLYFGIEMLWIRWRVKRLVVSQNIEG